jgi:hypothetical protein
MLIYDLTREFQKQKIPFAIVGGVALALNGIVRATLDLDLVIKLNAKNLELAEIALNILDLQSRIPVRAKEIFQFREQFIKEKNLIAWSFVDYKNPIRQVDILITFSLDDIEYKNIKVGGYNIPTATLKELAKMKKVAGRPQDLVDLEKINEKIKSTKK